MARRAVADHPVHCLVSPVGPMPVTRSRRRWDLHAPPGRWGRTGFPGMRPKLEFRRRIVVALSLPRSVGMTSLATSEPRPAAPATLRRTLGVWQVSIAGIGVILGAGVYGMATAGVLPRALGRIGRTATPWVATVTVLAVTVALLFAGSLAEVAAMTDAAVLLSFVLVNASLAWLACRGRAGPGRRRALDLALPGAAVMMCGALLLHVGVWRLAAAGGLAATGLLASWWPTTATSR